MDRFHCSGLYREVVLLGGDLIGQVTLSVFPNWQTCRTNELEKFMSIKSSTFSEIVIVFYMSLCIIDSFVSVH